MKIVFLGSGLFAFPIVQKIASEFALVAIVVTKPKPRGRGLNIALPKVAQWAQSSGIEVYAPENPNSETFITEIAKLYPDLFILSAYGHILGTELLRVPKLGGINIHPSLLPKYRGAAPIQRAIMAGEKKTGITIFFMDEKIDHGDIIFQKECAIEPDDNYGSVSSRLSTLGVESIVDVVRSIESGNYKKIKQDEQQKSHAAKIKKEETIIDWQEEAEKIINLVRALSPKPGARTTFRNKELKIIMALASDKVVNPGNIHIENKKIYVGTHDGSIILKEVKPENRRVILGLDFINGFHVKEGEILG